MFNFLESTLKGIEPSENQGGCFQIRWRWLAEGVMTIEPVDGYERHLILSAGIHGNETAPIEILNDLDRYTRW